MKKSKKELAALLFGALLTFLFTQSIFSQSNSEKIDELVSSYYSLGKFNGTVLVAEKGEILLSKGYGYANFEWEIPNTPDTKFRIGSMTKQFTSMLIMQLYEEGKIDLHAPITCYLKYYRKETGDSITIHHLLTHMSGIPSFTDNPEFSDKIQFKKYEIKDFVINFCSNDLQFKPGSNYRYSNSGYFILGAIIEEVTGNSYEEELNKRIFVPLGMTGSGYDHHNVIITKRADGYRSTYDGIENAPYVNMMPPFAAGALYSTTEDLFLWDRALYSNQLINEETKKIMLTPHVLNLGYGWWIATSTDGKIAVVHDGAITGFRSLIVRLVESDQLIVILDNSTSSFVQPIAFGINRILAHMPYSPAEYSIEDIVLEELKKNGIDKAKERFKELYNNPDAKVTSSSLNTLGYRLIGWGKIEDAIECFKLNANTFPDEANLWDSLAEGYMKSGDKEKAIQNYKKSLELNPENNNAREKLKELK